MKYFKMYTVYDKKLEIESSKNNKSMNLFLVCFRYLKLLPIFVPLQVHFKEGLLCQITTI
jgi:hypothetical protein